MDFPSVDWVCENLEELVEEIPEEIFKGLNLGVSLLLEEKIHPESQDGAKLYILGQYRRDVGGAAIVIFYGSFKVVYRYLSNDEIREKLKEVLLHELTHHLEYRAGDKDLEIEDEIELIKYRERMKGNY